MAARRTTTIPSVAPTPCERDERRARLIALRQQYPEATHGELAERYTAQFGLRFSKDMVSAGLQKAGVLTFVMKQIEVHERPRRIAELFSKMSHPTRDKLAEAYHQRHNISLSRDYVSRALRAAGIQLIEPQRKPDPEEIVLRPERLKNLAEEYPELNYDQLGRKYDEEYGIRLKAASIASTLNRMKIYRARLVDAEELSLRPGRFTSLVSQYPELGQLELAAEYKRLYGISLHEASVYSLLASLGLKQSPPIDSADLIERPGRLKALVKKYPTMPYRELAREYLRLYGKKLHVGSVEQALHRIGIYRLSAIDPAEIQERLPRLKRLLRKYPKLTNTGLAQKYSQMYGTPLSTERVTMLFNTVGIFRQRPKNNLAEQQQRPLRLIELCQKYPSLSHAQLAVEYEKSYGVSIHPVTVSQTLNRIGGYRRRQRRVDPQELKVRPKRLLALVRRCPQQTYSQLAKEYYWRYGTDLSPATVGHTLSGLGLPPRR